MSQVLVPGFVEKMPPLHVFSNTSRTAVTLNLTGETCHMIGSIILQNPLGGSKTISAAGSGKIVWNTGAITFADAGTTMEVGIQDVSTASAPGQGDGTFDVKASFTGGGGGITASAAQSSTMTSGAKTIAHGDLISITFAMTARAGVDSITVQTNQPGIHGGNGTTASSFPAVTDNTGGAYTRTFGSYPNAYIIFDDGTVGWLFGVPFALSGPTAQAYNSGTGTADEYGNLINVPGTFYAVGIEASMVISAATADHEMILYSNPLVTPVAERTITVDATQAGATGTVLCSMLLFSSPFLMRANTPYAITIRPTTANNITLNYLDGHNATGGLTGYPNSNCYSVRRLDNTGVFSDFNSGTAKTRFMTIWLVGTWMEQGINSGNYRIGI